MPAHPTRSAFVRASTLSLGSIAFGSLIVTILELIRVLLNWASQDAARDGNRECRLASNVDLTIDASTIAVMAILACCAACFIGCIEGLVEYFNKYAYIQIALYGGYNLSFLLPESDMVSLPQVNRISPRQRTLGT